MNLEGELSGSAVLPPVTYSDSPTLAELEVFLAIVEHGGTKPAAEARGCTSQTIRNTLSHLYAKLGARNRPHAAWLLWPVLGDAYVLPTDDRRSGRDRRMACR